MLGLGPGMRVLAFTLLTVACMSATWAQVSPSPVRTTISYQRKLTDAVGAPVPDGNHVIVLKLYATATGGAAVWTSPDTTVTTKGGVFTAAFTPSASLFEDGDLWIETVVGGKILSPRAKLQTVPFAIRASTADVAKSVPAGAITVSMLAADVVFMRAPYLTGVESGLKGKYSVRITIDDQKSDDPITLGGEYREWIEYRDAGPGQIATQRISYLTLRRKVGSDDTWRVWRATGTLLTRS
mgnify:CR=1 FL=1